MTEDSFDPTKWDWDRLRREAEAPLTPAELEQKRSNRKLAQFDASIQKLAMDLGRAKGRWLESRLLGLIPDSHPEWRTHPDQHAAAILDWMKTEGLWLKENLDAFGETVLMKGETVLSVFRPVVKGDKP